MSHTQLRIVVLYADVSGSTRLYEKFGDTIACADIHTCIEILSDVVEQNEGKKIKTIGDEIMCSFYRPQKAAEAAIQMNQELRDASEMGRFQSGEVHIKIGWHYGTGIFRDDDIIGEAPLLAQQVIGMAKRDEILTTQKSIDELPAIIKCTAKFIDRIEAEDGSGEFDVYALPWDDEDSDATVVVGGSEHDITGGFEHRALILRYKDQEFEMDHNKTHCHIGSGDDNDLVIHGVYTSRHHGEIFYRHGRFHLSDMSTNGTGLIHQGDDYVRLHREERMLSGSGTICFGGEPNTDPDAAVQYECVRAEN
ncbi:MAG: FHA domain-containing protein [Proteobacteria bacterium]|nr:FHA domain-containing protein [Pseudomonadota bacterium]NOG60036.1 FHA domain-containing protein [Pseudomonadota bacterium]